MLIQDLKEEFYQELKKSNTLILAHIDVDALCATKILLSILGSENIKYTIISVSTCENFIENLNIHKSVYRNIILINCGANIDIASILGPDCSSLVFIADNHFPFNLENIYSESQIRLFIPSNSFVDTLPTFNSIFAPLDNEEAVSSCWEEKRSEILEEYYKESYYGYSSSMMMFDFSTKLGKDRIEYVWYAICGLTEMFILRKISKIAYCDEIANLNQHVMRLTLNITTSDSSNKFRIVHKNLLMVYMYEHWSLMEGLTTSPMTASHFQVWTVNGQKKLFNFLADVGIPLNQCSQIYSTIDSYLRKNIKEFISSHSSKFGLTNILYPSFTAHFGYQLRISAADYVLTLISILDTCGIQNITSSSLFLSALQSMSKTNISSLESHLASTRQMLEKVSKMVSTFINLHYIISAGPFLFGVVTQGAATSIILCQPSILLFLANFALLAHSNMTKSKRAKDMPFVMTVPVPDSDNSIVVGIPPLSSTDMKNKFGYYFKKAVKSSKISVISQDLCPSILTIKTSERTCFFDALVSILI